MNARALPLLPAAAPLRRRAFGTGWLLLAACSACTPTVKVEAPDKPIEINLNVHIQQDVRVRLDRELDSAFGDHPELFGADATTRKPKEARP